jgi:hypothetical protein
MELEAWPGACAIACARTQPMHTCSAESGIEHSGTSFVAERRARSSLEKAPTRSVTPLPYPARARLRPVALRPTLSDGLPLSCRLSEETATEPPMQGSVRVKTSLPYVRRIHRETLALSEKTIYCLWLRIVLLKRSVGGLIAAGLKNSPIKGYVGWGRENYATRERRETAN